jgi:hypothetical protein
MLPFQNAADQNIQPDSLRQKDAEREGQLELEIQAFAELLLDIHEYRRKQRRNPDVLKPEP